MNREAIAEAVFNSTLKTEEKIKIIISLREGIGSIALFMLAPVTWVAYRTLRAAIDKKRRECGTFGFGKVRKMCMLRVELEEYNKMLQLLGRSKANCRSSSNPENCSKKADESIRKYRDKITKIRQKIAKYAAKSPEAAKKAERGAEKAAAGKTRLF